MHVCLLTMEWPPYGCGIASYMFNLARGLVSAGHRVTAITHDRDPGACPGVRIISIPLPSTRRHLARRVQDKIGRTIQGIRHPWSTEARRLFIRATETEPIDIVETADFGAWGWHFVRNTSVPVVTRCHSPSHIVWSADQYHSTSSALPSYLRKQDRLEREQTYLSNGIVSPSEALACHLSLSWVIPLSRFRVIPNPIDATLFCPSSGDVSKREILYVGRLEYNKGVYDLAEAISPILSEYKDICVRFVGMDRPAPDHLRTRGATASSVMRSIVPEAFHDRLLFTPHVPVSEVVRCQHRAMLAVVPTRGFESFSYTVLESMACGVPVIATRCGGPSEIITHAVDGWLTPPGDPVALTDAIRHLLSNPETRQELAAKGRQTVETRFSSEVVLPRIIEWYSEIIRQFQKSHVAK
jgi:glycosyltransferase involved in cell wall biosynthesis